MKRHYLPLVALSTAAITLLYVTRPYKDVVTRLSFATAYPALVLLTATLFIGPINLLLRRRNPVSSDLRRDIGILAGMAGTLHAAVGQCVHLRGRPWLYYVYGSQEKHLGLRHDLFGFANDTGLSHSHQLVCHFKRSFFTRLRHSAVEGASTLELRRVWAGRDAYIRVSGDRKTEDRLGHDNRLMRGRDHCDPDRRISEEAPIKTV
jgi:hypothetical protein